MARPYGVLLEFLKGIRQISSPIFEHLERFTCVFYDKTMAVSRVNELRQELFSKKAKLNDNIPPFLVCFLIIIYGTGMTCIIKGLSTLVRRCICPH